MERVKGIEPSYAAWEAAVLPLNYTRMGAVILWLAASASWVKEWFAAFKTLIMRSYHCDKFM